MKLHDKLKVHKPAGCDPTLKTEDGEYIGQTVVLSEAHRIAVCVNACAGIKDPETAINAARDLSHYIGTLPAGESHFSVVQSVEIYWRWAKLHRALEGA